ncbi:MAG: recombinase family protein [Eubacterium sp.]|jgi:DNA invertase Pin-like site-specific DNA recombinase|nr:recombinase family protein [Eubacterium sp.]MCH4078795.1 recombinase family protein [Eubacterium sp.]
MPKITKIEPKIEALPARKKVAAYARVSMETERLHHSLSAQVSYYSNLIQKNPEWEYAGVYADEGISGTSTARRPEFQKMLSDCEDGKIDIILTKSISRFARNTVDLLETVRHLKELGIEVQFEKEHIHSLSGDGEVMLTLLASFAQEESISISNNVKWGIRKRMQAGLPCAIGHTPVYGYRWEGDEMIIVPEEATVVKRIFQNFLDGKSRLETQRELAEEGITTRAGCQWADASIQGILQNITYTGNRLFQKKFIADPITKKVKTNHGELPQYFVEDTHPAIIDKEVFDAVQQEMERRRKLGCFANKSLNLNCFSTKVKCGNCGHSFVRSKRKTRSKTSQFGDQEIYWMCTSHKKKGKSLCKSGMIRERVLKEECAKVLGLSEFDEQVFTERVKQITILEPGTMIFEFTDGKILTQHWERNYVKDSWTQERKKEFSRKRLQKDTQPRLPSYKPFTGFLKCACCGKNYRHQGRIYKDGTDGSYWHCPSPASKCHNLNIKDSVIREMVCSLLQLDAFDESAMDKAMDYALVDHETVTFHFRDGHTETRTYQKKKRGTPHTEEYKSYMRQLMKKRWTNEEKEKMSKQMKKIRSEKFWSSKRK